MDQDFLRFGLAAFITLLVVVDPPGVVPIYVALTKDEQQSRRRAILVRAVLIAFGVALFFLIAGRAVLAYLGVTVHAFSISGGILLFVAAMPMLFGQRGGLQSPERKERSSVGQDISVFPLAMPMLAGPWSDCDHSSVNCSGGWRSQEAGRGWRCDRRGFSGGIHRAVSGSPVDNTRR